MKKKIFCIVFCMLMIGTTIPIVNSQSNIMKISETQHSSPQTYPLENWTETQKLIAFNGDNGDDFGYSVSIDDGTALIGARFDNLSGSHSGSAYVFIHIGSTWVYQAKLIPSDGETENAFGWDVSLDGDTAIIGAPQDNDNGQYSGSVYVFVRQGTTWSQQAKLVASDGGGNDHFGWAVALEGDTALISAKWDDDYGSNSGAVYVFTRNGVNWSQKTKLYASDSQPGAVFGYSLCLSGENALIGAVWDLGSGSAYIFTRSGDNWTQQSKLIPSDGDSSDNFGYSVSFSNDTALIGAIEDDDLAYDSGAAYVFTRQDTTWSQQAKLVASDGSERDLFGTAVSIHGDTVLIGSVWDDDYGNDSGAAYVFTRSGTIWTEQVKLKPSDNVAGDQFGISVILKENTMFIGANWDDDIGINSGSIYVFTKEASPGIPIINGPVNGKIKTSYNYNFTTYDQNNDDVYYWIDWGDGTNNSWIGPYPSGDTISQSHTWSKKGIYTIKVKAKDVNGGESDWGELPVTMPYSYNIPFKTFLERFFEWFPNVFSILRHLMGY